MFLQIYQLNLIYLEERQLRSPSLISWFFVLLVQVVGCVSIGVFVPLIGLRVCVRVDGRFNTSMPTPLVVFAVIHLMCLSTR